MHAESTASFEILWELCAQAGGPAALRRQMIDTGIVKKMDAPVLESWTRPAKDFDSIDPAAKTARLIASTGSSLPLHWLCGRAGVFFVPGRETFASILGQGARTWFAVSLQVHELRQTVIKAFIETPAGKPVIDEREGRLIARCWAAVFGWIEGFLEIHRGGLAGQSCAEETVSTAGLHPVLFRTTPPWQVLSEAFTAKGCPSRTTITEAVAHPFGKAVLNAKGDLCCPNENTIDKWSERRPTDTPAGTGTRGPLDYTLALCYGAQSLTPLEWLARQSGGTIVRPPKAATPSATDDDLLRFWERTMVELAELDASIARALLDQKIDESEVVRLRSEWADVVTWMRSFVSAW